MPAELKMGFRDEMEAAAAAARGEQAGVDEESAQLAEGFVQTAPMTQVTATDLAGAAAPAPAPVPAPTRTIPLPQNVPQQPQPQMRQMVRPPFDANAGVPPWVDYAIASLVVLLAAMILKIMSGY